MRQVELHDFLKASLQCSVFLSPRAPGLTETELIAVAGQVGYQTGEVRDAVRSGAVGSWVDGSRYFPRATPLWDQFHFSVEPDYRNLDAFDYVCNELRNIVRAEGQEAATIDRDVLVERAVARGLPQRDTEAAITILVMGDHFVEDAGVLRFARGREQYPTPREQWAERNAAHRVGGGSNSPLAKAYPLVKRLIESRADASPVEVEALDAFAETLEQLGYGPFRGWWKQTVGELRRQEPVLAPVSVCVLSAALVEGALTFVVKHGQTLGAFASSDFSAPPSKWKIEDLVKSASNGGADALFDQATKTRADLLIRTRQRIHAGRMLQDFPSGPTELRPEEPRDAKATVDIVVRRVLDWLKKHPPVAAK